MLPLSAYNCMLYAGASPKGFAHEPDFWFGRNRGHRLACDIAAANTPTNHRVCVGWSNSARRGWKGDGQEISICNEVTHIAARKIRSAMTDPVKSYFSDNCAEIYVWGARPYIREALKLDADIWVSAKTITTERALCHNAALRPVGKLPWPLSSVQAHDIQLIVTFNDFAKALNSTLKDVNQIYSWAKLDEALNIFLYLLPPNETVRILVT